jgi:hypothetical protein
MTYTSGFTSRLNDATRRFDLAADIALERGRRDVAEMRRADAAARADAIERAKRRDQKQQKFQSRYDSAYRAYGVDGAPPPHEGEDSERYRDRLAAGLQRRLPDGHALKDIDFSGLDYGATKNLESDLIADSMAEAAEPSPENLPETVDDPRAKRERTDSMGTKTITWAAKESFIRGLSRPARRVARICDPISGRVLYGPAFPVARLG